MLQHCCGRRGRPAGFADDRVTTCAAPAIEHSCAKPSPIPPCPPHPLPLPTFTQTDVFRSATTREQLSEATKSSRRAAHALSDATASRRRACAATSCVAARCCLARPTAWTWRNNCSCIASAESRSLCGSCSHVAASRKTASSSVAVRRAARYTRRSRSCPQSLPCAHTDRRRSVCMCAVLCQLTKSVQ